MSMALPADAEACVNPESFDEVVITFAEILVPSPGANDAGEGIRGGRFQGVTTVRQRFVANPASHEKDLELPEGSRRLGARKKEEPEPPGAGVSKG
jgi:hypothetical protein